jgi:hypothetical protein
MLLGNKYEGILFWQYEKVFHFSTFSIRTQSSEYISRYEGIIQSKRRAISCKFLFSVNYFIVKSLKGIAYCDT